MNAVKWLMALMQLAGPRILEVWPHVVNIYTEVLAILALVASEQMRGLAGPAQKPLTFEGKEFVKEMAAKGVDKVEAEQAAAAFEATDKVLGAHRA